jgi:hypothetical protein
MGLEGCPIIPHGASADERTTAFRSRLASPKWSIFDIISPRLNIKDWRFADRYPLHHQISVTSTRTTGFNINCLPKTFPITPLSSEMKAFISLASLLFVSAVHGQYSGYAPPLPPQPTHSLLQHPHRRRPRLLHRQRLPAGQAAALPERTLRQGSAAALPAPRPRRRVHRLVPHLEQLHRPQAGHLRQPRRRRREPVLVQGGGVLAVLQRVAARAH